MKLCIYGAGGFGKEVFDIAFRINEDNLQWSEIFFADDDEKLGGSFYSTYTYSFEYIMNNMDCSGIEFTIAVGEPALRSKIFDKLQDERLNFATIVDPSSIISKTSQVDEGVIIAPNCMVSSSVVLEKNVTINCQSIIGHDSIIGENSFISSMVTVGGNCTVNRNSYIGIGAQIKNGLSIGSEAIIGMGSIVHKNIPDSIIVIGNPARPILKNTEKKVFR